MVRISAILGAMLGFAAVPAAAGNDAFIAAAAAYTSGEESDTRPQEPNEFAYCAGYWNVWSDAVADGTIPEELWEQLPPVLTPPSVTFQTLAIFTKLKESDTLDAEVDEGRVEAGKFLAEALAGDVQSGENLFGTLGTCQVQ